VSGIEASGAAHSAGDLIRLVSLLAAAVIAVPLFRRIGLGSVLGYLAAGLAIGPFGLGLFSDPAAILHVAELGVVMFLFIIGLEMRPSHLWQLRGQIFGLGSLQIGSAIVALTAVLLAFGFSPVVAFIGGAGFVLTSTAIVFQALSERGDIATDRGQKMVSVLLFEDMLIVPLLALVAFMAPVAAEAQAGSRWLAVLVGMGAIAGLVVVGLWVLNPLFRYLAASRAREVMTAAALLVVLGSALLMELGGLSMAMGAFLAGVLLSESSFRHQLEADIEPFRGLLLGLFFLAVGMSLDLAVVAASWMLIAAAVPALMLAKAACIYGVARILRSGHDEALDRAVLMAQGGEFAFVLYAAAAGVGLISAQVNANLTAIVVLSMVLTPLLLVVLRPLLRRGRKRSLEGVESAKGLAGNVLVIGFGRFGQVACQSLLAGGVDVSIIDSDADMIRNAERFGFKVYYGDGTRLDILHASGADSACVILVCVDGAAVATQIARLIRHEFPQAKLLVRAYDREHARALVNLGVHYQLRETFESAMRFGREALEAVGVSDFAAAEVSDDIRRRDLERFNLELCSGSAQAGIDRLYRNAPVKPAEPLQPAPLVEPRRKIEARQADHPSGKPASG
jgi:glutathione-regulated potassium-efflux system protein KefB